MIWSAAGVVLSSIGVWTAATLDDLSESVSRLTGQLAVIELRLDGLPPPDLLLRVEQLENRIGKMETRIHDRSGRNNGGR